MIRIIPDPEGLKVVKGILSALAFVTLFYAVVYEFCQAVLQ